MKRLGLIIVSCIFSLLSVHTLYAQEQDKLLQLLKQELAADMQELQKQENPPYHMNFRVMDDRTVNISSSFGATMMSVEQHSRSMVPQIRVGDTILDNFKYNAMGVHNILHVRDSIIGISIPSLISLPTCTLFLFP